MNRINRGIVFMSLGLVVGCGAVEDTPAFGDDGESAGGIGAEQEAVSREAWVVDFQDYGPIPLGVDFEEAETASAGIVQEPEDLEGCSTTAIIGGPEGVLLMVVDGRLVRVDVRNEAVRTREGAGIGDTEERIQQLYSGAVEIQPHKYTDGHYLVVTPPDEADRRLIFETDGGVVTTYRAGVLPEVAWVEGCA